MLTRALWVSVLAAGAMTPARASELPPVAIPLVLHVTRAGTAPVATEAEVHATVATVNELYRPAGVCFVVREVRALDRSGDLVTHRDRRAFRRHTIGRALNVFLVGSIRDRTPSDSTTRAAARVGRTPSGWLAGAEIPVPKQRPSRYLIVRFASGALTLAHELGHFLGAGHHRADDNIMGYGTSRRVFDDAQLRTFRKHARKEVRSGALAKATCN